MFKGLDLALTARFGNGGQMTGGVSLGNTVNDTCYVDSPQNLRQGYCRTTLSWWQGQGQVKVNGVYLLPWWGLQTAFTVNSATGCTSRPGMLRARQRWVKVASTSPPSFHANGSPMHPLAPPPDGKYANGGGPDWWTGSHRSGRNAKGSSHQRGSRCTHQAATMTNVPWGAVYPPSTTDLCAWRGSAIATGYKRNPSARIHWA